MPNVTLNGQDISFDDHGGPGVPVVLGHGFMMDRTMFDAQVPALSPKYRVITWDARGFGETLFDEKPFTYWDLAKDCLALMDHLGIARAVVGGMSQGGFTALRVALTAPERVLALVLMDSQAGAEPPESVAANQQMMDTWVAVGPIDPLAEAVARIIIDHPDHDGKWIAKWKTRDHKAPGFMEPGRCLNGRESIVERLGEIGCPVLLIHGTKDTAITVARMQETTKLLRNQRTVLIEGGAHAANMTHPGPTNEALLAFLGGVSV